MSLFIILKEEHHSLPRSHLCFSLMPVFSYDLLAELKNKDHVSCLSSLASRLLLQSFRVPKLQIFPKSQGLYEERKLYIRRIALRFALSSPRAYIGTEGEAQDFPSLRGYMGRARNFSNSQGLYIEGKVYMTTHTSLRTSRFQSLYGGREG